MFRSLSVFFFALVLVSPVFSKPPKGVIPNLDCLKLLEREDPRIIRVGHLNGENVFDNVDDKNKDDKQFLPLAFQPPAAPNARTRKIDWTREKLQIKLRKIHELVANMGYPDLLSMVEVENETVASWIAQTCGYTGFIMSHSLDARGINVVLFYRESKGLILESKNTIPLDDGEEFSLYKTRDILEGRFRVNGKHDLYIHVNHWPSQRGPTESRYRAAEKLLARYQEIRRRDPKAILLATGDFNVIDQEKGKPHPFNDLLLSENEPHHYFDIDKIYRSSRKVAGAAKDVLPEGTYFYDKTEQWNLLDRMFISPNGVSKAASGLKVNVASYRIHNPDFASTTYTMKKDGSKILVPRGYNFHADDEKDAGYTDHYGVTLDLEDKDYKP